MNAKMIKLIRDEYNKSHDDSHAHTLLNRLLSACFASLTSPMMKCTMPSPNIK